MSKSPEGERFCDECGRGYDEWKNFNEQMPMLCPGKLICISDGKSIKVIHHYIDDWDTAKFPYWQWIQIPELPKPKPHWCENDDWHCLQEFNSLWIGNCHHRHMILVKICPFCGYKPPSDCVMDTIRYCTSGCK